MPPEALVKGASPMSGEEALQFRRSIVKIATAGWGLSLLGVVAAIIWWGDVEGWRIQDMPLLGLSLKVLLFPGLHLGAFVWLSILLPLGFTPPSGPDFTWVGLGIAMLASGTAAAFWAGIVPWLVTATRVYLWPYPLHSSSKSPPTKVEEP